MNGKCGSGYKIEDTPICIDYWNPDDCDSSKFYFLTHVHQRSILFLDEFWNQPIYCSPTTAKIASIILDLPMEHFIPIEVGQTRTVKCDHIKGSVGKSFDVTALNSDHCYGSTMFYFDGWFGKILATGCFRFENEELFNVELLYGNPIHRVYLDITNWKQEQDLHLDIPTRFQSTVKALEMIAQRPSDDIIFLVMPDSIIGQEWLLTVISRNFDELIAVSAKRLRILQAIEKHRVFTDDQKRTRFRLLCGSYQQMMKAFVDEINLGRTVSVFVFATPANYDYWRTILNSASIKGYEFRQCAHLIPYSDHSTTAELESFLERLTIRRLIPVGYELDAAEMDLLRKRFESPEVVPETMEEDNVGFTVTTIVIGTPPTTQSDPDFGPDTIPYTESQAWEREPFKSMNRRDEIVNGNVEPMDMNSNSDAHDDDDSMEPSPEELKRFIINESNNMVFTALELDAFKYERDHSK